MILDTSAIIAILFEEDEAADFAALIDKADSLKLSAVNFVELEIVSRRTRNPAALGLIDDFIAAGEIEIVPVSVEMAYLARAAFRDFGKGRHPAQLNFGDCFAYALAKATGEALLFKGNDFSLTDVTPALASRA